MEAVLRLMKEQEARHKKAMAEMRDLLAAASQKKSPEKTSPEKTSPEKTPKKRKAAAVRRSPRKRPRVRYETPPRDSDNGSEMKRSNSYQKQLGKQRTSKSAAMQQLRKDIGIRVARFEPDLVAGKYNHPVTNRFYGQQFENDIRESLDAMMGDDMDATEALECFRISKDIAQKRRRYLLKKMEKQNKSAATVLAESQRVQAALAEVTRTLPLVILTLSAHSSPHSGVCCRQG